MDKVARDLLVDWKLGAGSPGAALEAIAAFPSSPFASHSPGPDIIAVRTLESSELPLPAFPIPFRGQLAFSFSGLRSALTRHLLIEPASSMSPARKQMVVRTFLKAAFGQLEDKVRLGVEWWSNEVQQGRERGHLEALVGGGGVGSNMFLRERYVFLKAFGVTPTLDSSELSISSSRLQHVVQAASPPMKLVFPTRELCTDNAAMIGYTGLTRWRRGRLDDVDSVMPVAKWSITDCESDFVKNKI